MAIKKKRARPLSAGRPPTSQRPKSISRKATKALINQFHLLEKKKRQAASIGDEAAVAAHDAEIKAIGGLEAYQEASLQGQRDDRGGDSSHLLVRWLEPCTSSLGDKRLRLLEVGALSTSNACSRSGFFDIERIDLNSQGDGILQQDFMERALPQSGSERFDVISLSLVLNFVPDAQLRGEMLARTVQFLSKSSEHQSLTQGELRPSLFLVLPAPCVTNSRYLDDERLEVIMGSLGYTKTKSKMTKRLAYYLWVLDSAVLPARKSFTKTEIRPGPMRNNFAIVLK
jgi:25S rRNA (adenine2142-N1)-methyltransferase